MLGGDPAQCRVVAGLRGDGSHVARGGLGDDRGDGVAESRERRLNRLDVVVGQHDCVSGSGSGDPGRGRQAEGRHPRTGVGQQRIDMAVVAAGELDDL